MTDKSPETIFEEVALSSGLLTGEQIKECHKIRDNLVKMGLTSRSLLQIALERGYLSADQAKKVQRQMQQGGVRPKLGGFELLAKVGAGGM